MPADVRNLRLTRLYPGASLDEPASARAASRAFACDRVDSLGCRRAHTKAAMFAASSSSSAFQAAPAHGAAWPVADQRGREMSLGRARVLAVVSVDGRTLR